LIRRTSTAGQGLDAWRTVGNIRFLRWDHWFLLLVFGDCGGDWVRLRDLLRAKRRGAGYEQDDAESKLSHLADLETRWGRSENRVASGSDRSVRIVG
jgi:hypothetical protein